MSEELATVARLMVEHRLDSVEMPSGLKVLKTTHAPFSEAPPPVGAVEAAVARHLEALGILNATEESGRIPVPDDEVMFAASRAPALDSERWRPAQPGEESSDGEAEAED